MNIIFVMRFTDHIIEKEGKMRFTITPREFEFGYFDERIKTDEQYTRNRIKAGVTDDLMHDLFVAYFEREIEGKNVIAVQMLKLNMSINADEYCKKILGYFSETFTDSKIVDSKIVDSKIVDSSEIIDLEAAPKPTTMLAIRTTFKPANSVAEKRARLAGGRNSPMVFIKRIEGILFE